MLIAVIVGIALLSLLMSYLSIQNDEKKSRHVEQVKKDLEKGRVIYYAQSSGLAKHQDQSA